MEPKYLINFIKAGAFAALLTPFIKNMNFYFPFVGPKGLYFMALAEAMFFAWIILAWRWKQFRPNFKNPVIAAILLFLAISIAGAILGADFSASFWSKFERMGGILMLCHLGAFALAILSVFEKKDWIWLFCVSSAAAAAVGVQALFDLSAQSRGGGFIGNDSFWGTYILFNIFIALYLFLSQNIRENKKIKIFAGAVFLILAICLLLEGSQLWAGILGNKPELWQGNLLFNIIDSGARAAKISFLAGMALLGILWLAVRKNIAVRVVGLLILAAAAIIAAAVVFSMARQDGVIYKAAMDKFGQSSIYGRVVVWNIAWAGFLDRPYLGWGPENFNLAFARHYNSCLGSDECGTDINYDRAHNIVLDTLVEVGAVGFASYVIIFIAAFYVLWKGYFAARIGFAEFGVFISLFCAYFLQNLTVFDMVVSYVMWFMCLGFIAWNYDQNRSKEKVWPQPLGMKRILPTAGGLIVCLCVFVMGPMTSDYDTVKAASAPYGSPQRIDLYRRTLEASPLGRYQIRMFFANQWLQAAGDPKLAGQITKQQAEDIFSILSGELEKSVRESPLDFQSWLELGQIYNAWSQIDESKIAPAENSLQTAMKLSPNNQQVYWYLAQTRILQARMDDALTLAQQAYDLSPSNPQSKAILETVKNLKDRPVAAK